MSRISNEKIIVLDFGSQYTKLIARRVRELNVYSQIFPYNADPEKYMNESVKGIILSGGPSTILKEDSPKLPADFYQSDVPILGLCYGMQLIADNFGAELSSSEVREYGKSEFSPDEDSPLLDNLPSQSTVWMSHGDHIERLPGQLSKIGSTEDLDIAALQHKELPIYGLQFHPEVIHTDYGEEIFNNFVYEICECRGSWTSQKFIDKTLSQLQEDADDTGKIILGYSGGVDSTLVTSLLLEAFDEERVIPIFINNGLLRLNEAQEVRNKFQDVFDFEPVYIDASETFLEALEGVVDPEKKRNVIGETFIDVFSDEANKHENVRYLAQGTLYPDVIESQSYFGGPTSKIKSHHNVGGLPEELEFDLIEPLKELFKDEVREVCDRLDIPRGLSRRHPFPGPGLAVRIIGSLTRERLQTLREADDIFISLLHESGYYDEVWQAFCVLLPIRSVGVMGDERTYQNVVALRAVTSKDGMTADWANLPHNLLRKASSRIINRVDGINRVTYDISSKPPSTIEWE